MNKRMKMKKIIVAGFTGLLIVSCSEGASVKDNRDSELVSTIAAGGESEKELEESLKAIREEEEAKLKAEQENMTSIEFDKIFHDFGDVQPEVENTTTFVVKNTGDKPLVIEDVSASCGCTMPEKPTEPIMPGKTDNITVTFKSKPGQMNEQKKTVTVTANTNPKVHKLEIRAFVKGN